MQHALVLAVLVVTTIVGVRLARVRGWLKSASRCEACGRAEPSASLKFFKNTGLIIIFSLESDGGTLCRSCGLELFTRMTGHTVLFGWWGMVSFFVNWLLLANNLGNAVWAMTLPGQAAVAGSALDGEREYALNLLNAGKAHEDIVHVLRRQTGASTEAIEAWLTTLQR